MPKKLELNKQFVEVALDTYQNLEQKERESIKYKDLIEMIMRKLNGEKFKESDIKRGYEQFRLYYFLHPLTKVNSFAKCEDDDVFLEDVYPLLKYDIFKTKTLKILSDKDTIYRYYWFDQIVINPYSQKEKRRILIFESDMETCEIIYRLMSIWFDLCESFYCGFGGIVMIFQNADEKHYFESFLKCIRKK